LAVEEDRREEERGEDILFEVLESSFAICIKLHRAVVASLHIKGSLKGT
jgi:hypothetical protein